MSTLGDTVGALRHDLREINEMSTVLYMIDGVAYRMDRVQRPAYARQPTIINLQREVVPTSWKWRFARWLVRFLGERIL